MEDSYGKMWNILGLILDLYRILKFEGFSWKSEEIVPNSLP